MSVKLAIVIPIFNNFQCLSFLVSDTGRQLPSTLPTTLFVVNDGSTNHLPKLPQSVDGMVEKRAYSVRAKCQIASLFSLRDVQPWISAVGTIR